MDPSPSGYRFHFVSSALLGLVAIECLPTYALEEWHFKILLNQWFTPLVVDVCLAKLALSYVSLEQP
jgi:hypothetical protein